MGVASGIELGCSYELGSGRTRIGVMTRPRWGLGTVMTIPFCIYLSWSKISLLKKFSHSPAQQWLLPSPLMIP